MQQQQSNMVKPQKVGGRKLGMNTKFVPTYGGKKGGKMSNGVGWGGEKPMKKITPKKKSLPSKSKVMSSVKKAMGY